VNWLSWCCVAADWSLDGYFVILLNFLNSE
jgi:hypothetical protein